MNILGLLKIGINSSQDFIATDFNAENHFKL